MIKFFKVGVIALGLFSVSTAAIAKQEYTWIECQYKLSGSSKSNTETYMFVTNAEVGIVYSYDPNSKTLTRTDMQLSSKEINTVYPKFKSNVITINRITGEFLYRTTDGVYHGSCKVTQPKTIASRLF